MKKILIAISLFIAQAAMAQQDTTDVSLLTKYRSMALHYNDDLKAAQKHITASIELTKAARADKGPKLAAGADFSFTGNPLELSLNLPGAADPASFRGSNFQYSIALTLLQPIYTGGRIVESIKMAQSEQTIARSQSELIRSLVCYQTDIQYWNTVARSEMSKVMLDYRNSVLDLTRIVGQRVEVGMSDPQELLTVEVKLNEAQYQLLQAQSEQQTALMALNALIGVPLTEQTLLDTAVVYVEPINLNAVADSNSRPEIKIAQQRINFENSAMRLTDSRYKPQINIGLSGGIYSPGYNFRPDLSPNYALYAQVSIPILEWGKRHRQKRAAEQRIGMAKDNLHQIELDVELEIRTANAALTQSIDRVNLSKSSLGKAQQNERLTVEKYEEGMISISEVIDAQVYRQTAHINYVNAKTAAQIHYAELLKAACLYNYE